MLLMGKHLLPRGQGFGLVAYNLPVSQGRRQFWRSVFSTEMAAKVERTVSTEYFPRVRFGKNTGRRVCKTGSLQSLVVGALFLVSAAFIRKYPESTAMSTWR